MTVLIAEDDAVSRTVLKKTLENLGHDCIAAEDGLEAWEAYQNRQDVEVIISYRMMPNMDGIEFCKRVDDIHFSAGSSHICELLITEYRYIQSREGADRTPSDCNNRLIHEPHGGLEQTSVPLSWYAARRCNG